MTFRCFCHPHLEAVTSQPASSELGERQEVLFAPRRKARMASRRADCSSIWIFGSLLSSEEAPKRLRRGLLEQARRPSSRWSKRRKPLKAWKRSSKWSSAAMTCASSALSGPLFELQGRCLEVRLFMSKQSREFRGMSAS